MIENKGKFISFSDNTEGNVGKLPNYYIDNALYVEGLKHNLLSISQFCDKEN